MGKMKKAVLNTFESGDYKRLEDYLNDMAGKGWRVRKMTVMMLHFVRDEIPGARYAVDIFHKDKNTNAADYMELCAEAGWQPAAHCMDIFLFRAAPGTDPIPIQTDPEMEYRAVRRSMLPIDFLFLGFALLFLCAGIFFSVMGRREGSFLPVILADTFWFPLLYFVLCPFYLLYAGVDFFWLLRQKRRLRAKQPLIPMPPLLGRGRQATAAVFVLFTLLFAVGSFGYPQYQRSRASFITPGSTASLTLSQLGREGPVETEFKAYTSEAVPVYTSYQETLSAGRKEFVRTRTWKCRDGETAQALYEALKSDGIRLNRAEFDSLDPIPWGAEEAGRLLRPGDAEEGVDSVLLRHGAVVLELRGSFDFSAEAALAAELFSAS